MAEGRQVLIRDISEQQLDAILFRQTKTGLEPAEQMDEFGNDKEAGNILHTTLPRSNKQGREHVLVGSPKTLAKYFSDQSVYGRECIEYSFPSAGNSSEASIGVFDEIRQNPVNVEFVVSTGNRVIFAPIYGPFIPYGPFQSELNKNM